MTAEALAVVVIVVILLVFVLFKDKCKKSRGYADLYNTLERAARASTGHFSKVLWQMRASLAESLDPRLVIDQWPKPGFFYDMADRLPSGVQKIAIVDLADSLSDECTTPRG
jgi:hypothetical protein